jgi:hypothetical protein
MFKFLYFLRIYGVIKSIPLSLSHPRTSVDVRGGPPNLLLVLQWQTCSKGELEWFLLSWRENPDLSGKMRGRSSFL